MNKKYGAPRPKQQALEHTYFKLLESFTDAAIENIQLQLGQDVLDCMQTSYKELLKLHFTYSKAQLLHTHKQGNKLPRNMYTILLDIFEVEARLNLEKHSQ